MKREPVVINDVGPRDGLQNQQKILPPEDRIQLVKALMAAGLRNIEVGSFVSPRSVPAMTGADQILAGLPTDENMNYTVLIPNMKGYELATQAGARSLSMVLYASEGMAQANANMSMKQAEDITAQIVKLAHTDGVRVSAVISVSFECPFEGPVDPAVVEGITDRLLQLGTDEVGIADTIGAAHPQQVRSLTSRLVGQHGADRLSCHFHDTRAMGLANVFAGIESGIRKFDASIGGLGGCPFAPGASGNVATEDVVMMLEQMGFDTGVSLPRLLEAADLAKELTGTAPGGRASPWLRRYLERTAAA